LKVKMCSPAMPDSGAASVVPTRFSSWRQGRDRPGRRDLRKQLDEFAPPPLDDAIQAELADYVASRRAELGD